MLECVSKLNVRVVQYCLNIFEVWRINMPSESNGLVSDRSDNHDTPRQSTCRTMNFGSKLNSA